MVKTGVMGNIIFEEPVVLDSPRITAFKLDRRAKFRFRIEEVS
ncbi:MAG: hypothetical protein QXO15_01065 [Nitrososphaerota archaeon]